ncbi:MAG: hypothetical protein AAGA03_08340 [Planctomycetota bacterium]
MSIQTWRTSFALTALIVSVLSPVGWCQDSTNTDPDPVVVLHTEYLPYTIEVEDGIERRQTRELVRQSFLLAVHRDLGLPVVDGTLQETIPTHRTCVHLALLERSDRNGNWWIKLHRTDEAPSQEEIAAMWNQEADYETFFTWQPAALAVPRIAFAVEAMSRREFVKAIEAVGLKRGESSPPLGDAEIDEVHDLLRRVDFVSQVVAVRLAHKALLSEPNSQAFLAALIRGYANLCLLTQHQWTAAHDVFAARAVLYSRRLQLQHGKTPLTRETVAYAWALVGLHERTLSLLREHDVDQREPWVRLAKLYATRDSAGLAQAVESEPQWRPWSTRMRFQIEASLRYSEWMLNTFEEVLEACPTAYGTYAMMASHGITLEGTRLGAMTVGSIFLDRWCDSLRERTDLPAETRARLGSGATDGTRIFGIPLFPTTKKSADPITIAGQLRSTEEDDWMRGISWSALGSLIDEELFVQAAHLAAVSTNATESDLSDLVQSLRPQIDGHRYAGLIESYGYRYSRQPEAYVKTLKDVQIRDPRVVMRKLLERTKNIRNDQGKRIGLRAISGVEHNQTYDDMIDRTFNYGQRKTITHPDHMRVITKQMRKISPHSEVGIRLEIELARSPVVEQLKRWEQQLRRDPEAFRLLGRRYRKLEKDEEAIRCFKKAMSDLAYQSAAYELADVHYDRGEIEQWEQTHLDYVNHSRDMGLGHAGAYASLATRFGEHGEWSRAQPYADRAASTYAAWALLNASRVAEAQASWDISEHWVRACSEGYPTGAGEEWFFWCCRTDRGERSEARDIAAQAVQQRVDVPRPTYQAWIDHATFHLVEEDLSIARNSLLEAERISADYMVRLMILDVATQLEDFDQINSTVITLRDDLKRSQNTKFRNFEKVTGMALRMFAGESLERTEIDALPELFKKLSSDAYRSQLAYTLGAAFDAIGDQENAERFWRRSLNTSWPDRRYATLAGNRLISLTGTSHWDRPLEPADVWPQRPWPQPKPEN